MLLASLALLAAASAAGAAPQKESPVLVGGGIDAGAGATVVGGVADPTGGAPQVEGDLGVTSGAFAMRVDLDLGVVVDAQGLTPVTLVPEQLWLKVGGPSVFLAAGQVVAPWRQESVDPWDRGLTSTSMLTRKGLPTFLAGGAFGGGTKQAGAIAIVGVDLGRGIDLLAPPSSWASAAPLLLGAHGGVNIGVVELGLGGFYRPGPRTGAVELDAAVDVEAVRVEATGLAGLAAPSGAVLTAEVLPHFLVSPTARVEWYAGEPGGALGVALRPAPFVRLAAEAGYADGAPSVWVGADLFTPGTSRRSGDGGDLGR